MVLSLVIAKAFLTASALVGRPSSHDLVHGMTISCQTWGWEWGTDEFGLELDELRALGVNWVAIHPYARIHGDGRVTWREWGDGALPEWIERPIREAHARGMAILVKPHLAYWGGPFRWRGEIAFEGQAAERFFADYTRWIAEVAEVAREADALAVGTELDAMLADEAAWRSVIAAVRGRTDALLTYAANWDSYDRVGFWDALDAVGVQAYFPLAEGERPRRRELVEGWARALEPLRDLARSSGKPVVFTELGYNLSTRAAAEPWHHASARGAELALAADLQELCLRTGLEVMHRERDWLRGAFLWKWFVGETRGENFLVDTPRLRDALSDAWLSDD